MPAASMELSITITKIQVFLVRPDNMPRSTYKCLNIYYPSSMFFKAILKFLVRFIFLETNLKFELVIRERSEPLYRVFNDQPRDIYIW